MKGDPAAKKKKNGVGGSEGESCMGQCSDKCLRGHLRGKSILCPFAVLEGLVVS